jgi:hypothetical protein
MHGVYVRREEEEVSLRTSCVAIFFSLKRKRESLVDLVGGVCCVCTHEKEIFRYVRLSSVRWWSCVAIFFSLKSKSNTPLDFEFLYACKSNTPLDFEFLYACESNTPLDFEFLYACESNTPLDFEFLYACESNTPLDFEFFICLRKQYAVGLCRFQAKTNTPLESTI